MYIEILEKQWCSLERIKLDILISVLIFKEIFLNSTTLCILLKKKHSIDKELIEGTLDLFHYWLLSIGFLMIVGRTIINFNLVEKHN